jgi:beta-lactamase superfamily II metal-dependent hydrolase
VPDTIPPPPGDRPPEEEPPAAARKAKPEVPDAEPTIREVLPDLPLDFLNFYALNVGAGNVLILTMGGKAMLFDSGTLDRRNVATNGPTADFSRPFVDPGCSILHGKEIVAVAITHPHKDHFNLILELLRTSNTPAQQVQFICGGSRGQLPDALRTNISTSAIFSVADDADKGHEIPAELSRRIEQYLNDNFGDPRLRFEVFLPQKLSLKPSAANIHITASIMFKIAFCGRSILVTGDGESQTVESFARPLGRTDVYMVPHHGSGHNNAKRFLPGAAAKVAICSIDARTGNARKFRLPHKAAIDQFLAAMPKKTAPKHKVLYWDGKAKSGEKREAPNEIEVEIPFFTTAGSFFEYRGKTLEGVHIQFQPEEGDVVATAVMGWKEADEVRKLQLDSFVG